MKTRIRLQGALVVALCLACLPVSTWAVGITAQLSLAPAPIARSEMLTIGVLLENISGSALTNTTLYVPLPLGIDQWKAEVRIDGGIWMEYPANGLIALAPIPTLNQMAVDIQVPVESASPAALSVIVQLLDATGILAQATGWVNVLPSVDAGPDLITELGTPIALLDSSASDGGGVLSGYLWTDFGAGGSFDDNLSLRPTYTPPAFSGVIELKLTVTDVDSGESSDSLRIRVNAAPNVEIGGDVSVEEGGSVQLWPTSMSDPDGWIADIEWSDGDVGGTFLPSNGVLDPVYMVPEIAGCEDAVIVLTLVLTDNWGATSSDAMTLHVSNINESPSVYLPEDLEAVSGRQVDLSAIASDEDGWIEEQVWEQVDGTGVDLRVGSQDQHVWFAVPDVDGLSELVFRFTARDNCSAEVWDDVTVTVLPTEGTDDTPVVPPPDNGSGDTPIVTPPEDEPDYPPPSEGSLSVSLDVFDERGLPMSPFDNPKAGDTITIRVSVINTGASMLGNLTATSNGGSPVDLRSDVLEPWSSTMGTIDWLVSADDLAGGLEIAVAGTGTDALGRTVTGSDVFEFLGELSSQDTGLSLVKTVSVSEASVGETIVYEYWIANIGSDDLVGLTLLDDQLGWIDLPTTLLRPGGAVEVKVSYVVRESDLPGPLVNRAVATGFTQQGDKIEAKAEASVELLTVAGGGGSALMLQGRVVISEIAWAGSPYDPADEWIELANIGTAAVDLTGWRLSWHAKRGTVPLLWQSIELSGVIQPLAESAWRTTTLEFVPLANGLWSVHDPRWFVQDIAAGFFLIERANDDVIADVLAGLVYGDAANPYFELPDTGAAIFLIDPAGKVVDSANAQYANGTGWPAGNASTGATMERINLSQGDFDGNWQTSSGVLTHGTDASGRGLTATAGMPNSLALEIHLQDATAAVIPVEAAGLLAIPIPDTSSSDRVRIQMTALAGSAAGGGGAVESPRLSTIRSSGGVTLGVDLQSISSGGYLVWITLKNGQALVLPIQI